MAPPDLTGRLADGYRADTRTLADTTADEVGAWHDRLDARMFPTVASLSVAVANRRATVLAAKYAADSLSLSLGEPVLVPDVDPERYADIAHLRRVLTGADRVTATRIASNEPLSAGRAALRWAQRSDGRVVAAQRVGGNCPICAPKNGQLVPPDADVSSHPNCDCTTIPITT